LILAAPLSLALVLYGLNDSLLSFASRLSELPQIVVNFFAAIVVCGHAYSRRIVT
jgi:hypothetical protein